MYNVHGKTTHELSKLGVCVSHAHSRTHRPRTLTHTMRYCKWASRMYSFARRPVGGEGPARQGGRKMRFCAVLSALATFMSKYKCVTDNVLNTRLRQCGFPAFGLNYTCLCTRHLDFLHNRAVTSVAQLSVSNCYHKHLCEHFHTDSLSGFHWLLQPFQLFPERVERYCN